MAESVSSDFVRQVRLALEVLAGGSSISPTDELAALVGGGLSSYALVGRSGSDNDQTTNVAAGDHMEFDQIIEGSGVSVSGAGGSQSQANGLIELESAGVWLLVGSIGVAWSASGGSAFFRWRNNTAAADIPNSQARLNPLTSAINGFANTQAVALINVATAVQVELRLQSASLISGLSASNDNGMRAIILKLA